MLDELRNGGEACSFKTVLTLQRETTESFNHSKVLIKLYQTRR